MDNTVNSEIYACIYYCDSLTAFQNASFNFCDFISFCITLLKNIKMQDFINAMNVLLHYSH